MPNTIFVRILFWFLRDSFFVYYITPTFKATVFATAGAATVDATFTTIQVTSIEYYDTQTWNDQNWRKIFWNCFHNFATFFNNINSTIDWDIWSVPKSPKNCPNTFFWKIYYFCFVLNILKFKYLFFSPHQKSSSWVGVGGHFVTNIWEHTVKQF